jgi:hypothetical protein
MKEHGLQLSDPMARARHMRLKTQTRRLITLRNSNIDGHGSRVPYKLDGATWESFDFSAAIVDGGPSPAGNAGPYLKVPLNWAGEKHHTRHRFYPRVQVGDRIWWRECHKVMATDSMSYYPELNDGRPINPGTDEDQQEEEYPITLPIYRATDEDHDLVMEDDNGDDKPVHWTPSQFMRRKWARFVDTVVAVRPERLSSISEADCMAEGIVATPGGEYVWDQLALERSEYDHLKNPYGPKAQWLAYPTARECYMGLLQKLHGEGIVEEDPWLWVITVEHGVTETR